MLKTVVFLFFSNLFMTFAWYGHLKNLNNKIQEVITMIVFAAVAILYMKQPVRANFLWAGLCLVGAVYFMFRDGLPQQ